MLNSSYFDKKSWEERADDCRTRALNRQYWDANVKELTKRLNEKEVLVVNIGAHALSKLLDGYRYKNTYILELDGELTHKVGEAPALHKVEAERKRVDDAFELKPARDFFFAAVSLEGTGVRYYGEYCMVLSIAPPDDTQIVDRDSYELLFAPLDSLPDRDVVGSIRGNWGPDLRSVAVMKARDVVGREERITTPEVLATALLTGQEYVEVHLKLSSLGPIVGFGYSALTEVRQDARDVAEVERIDRLWDLGEPPTPENLIYSLRRKGVEQKLSMRGVRSRVVREARS